MNLTGHKRNATPPKAVIFDIGRVIVRVSPRRAFEPLVSGQVANSSNAPLKLSAEQLWQQIEADSRWADWQEGRMTPGEWHEHASRRLGISIGFAEFCAAWNRALDPETILSDRLFARLATCCQLALLSNTDPIHATYLEQHFAFVRHFPTRIYSCNLGLRKPDPAIYHAALNALGVSPAEALYIDDIDVFVDAARKLALDTIHYQSAPQLEAELSRRGLLVE